MNGKSLILRMVVLCCAAFALYACGVEEMPEKVGPDGIPEQVVEDGPVSGVKEIHFQAVPAETKAQFGDEENGKVPTLWTAGDTELMLSLNYTSAQSAGVTPASDFKSASFSAAIDFTGVDGPYTYYAVSPASAAMALSPSREAWKVSIPSEQTPTAGSVDENAIILASASAPYTTVDEAKVVDLSFEHLTAYGRMSLSNLSIGSGETISSVELTITTPFVGDWYWTCEPGQGGHALTDYGASSTLTINTSGTSGIWFGCAPVDVSGEILVVSVTTEAGVYTNETIFPSNCKFTAGKVARFTIDMTGADFTAFGSSGSGGFTLVTDASTLAAGDEVLIVCTAEETALGPLSSNGNFRDAVDVAISNDSIATEGTATVLTLEAGKTGGTWAFKDGDNYLASPTASSNYLQNSTSVTANASWEVTISGGIATIHATSGSRSYMLYNPTYPRFTCYDSADKSGMKKVSIYRRTASGGGISPSDPLLSEAEYGCYLGSGLEWTLNSGTDQVTRSYDSAGVLTYTLINPANVEELEIIGYNKSKLKGDSFDVTVNWRRGTTRVHSSMYKMTLIKEQGPKVWLSDGAGKGFIIKK